MAGVAGRKYTGSVFCQDAVSDHLRRSQDTAMSHCAAEGGAQGDHGSDIRWPLCRDGSRDNPSQTVADQVNRFSCFGQGLLDGFIQLPLNQEVWTLIVEPYAGKERFVSDSCQPLSHWRHVNIGAEKSGNENYGGTVAMRYPQTVIQRRGMQQYQFRCKQHLAKDRYVSFLKILNTNRGTGIPGDNVGSSHCKSALLYVRS